MENRAVTKSERLADTIAKVVGFQTESEIEPTSSLLTTDAYAGSTLASSNLIDFLREALFWELHRQFIHFIDN